LLQFATGLNFYVLKSCIKQNFDFIGALFFIRLTNKQTNPLQGARKTFVSSSTATFPVRETNHTEDPVMINFELRPQFSPAKEQMIIHRCECAKEKYSLLNFSSEKQMMKCWIIMSSCVM